MAKYAGQDVKLIGGEPLPPVGKRFMGNVNDKDYLAEVAKFDEEVVRYAQTETAGVVAGMIEKAGDYMLEGTHCFTQRNQSPPGRRSTSAVITQSARGSRRG